MTPAARAGRERLAHLVAERRKQLGLSIARAARTAKIGRGTWTAIEQGSRETEEYIYPAVERTLQWGAGSIGEVLAGGQPNDATELAPSEPPAGARAVVEQIIEILSSRFSDSTKIGMIRDVIERDFGSAGESDVHQRATG